MLVVVASAVVVVTVHVLLEAAFVRPSRQSRGHLATPLQHAARAVRRLEDWQDLLCTYMRLSWGWRGYVDSGYVDSG